MVAWGSCRLADCSSICIWTLINLQISPSTPIGSVWNLWVSCSIAWQWASISKCSICYEFSRHADLSTSSCSMSACSIESALQRRCSATFCKWGINSTSINAIAWSPVIRVCSFLASSSQPSTTNCSLVACYCAIAISNSQLVNLLVVQTR